MFQLSISPEVAIRYPNAQDIGYTVSLMIAGNHIELVPIALNRIGFNDLELVEVEPHVYHIVSKGLIQ